VRFLWTKGLNTKDIHKEVFPVYCGKCLSHKAVHSWVQKFSEKRSEVADDARRIAEVAETTVKRLLCCGFRRADNAMGQVYQCLWRICREIPFVNVFLRFNYHMFYVLYPFVTYILIFPRTDLYPAVRQTQEQTYRIRLKFLFERRQRGGGMNEQ
jgi:hypothetical protein